MLNHQAIVHPTYDVAGMASEKDLDKLSTQRSPEFDIEFLNTMIEHHKGVLDMVQIIRNSQNKKVSSLAQVIISAQQAQIQQMEDRIRKLTNA
jgi:uncharacterized protein (DUF305 family)